MKSYFLKAEKADGAGRSGAEKCPQAFLQRALSPRNAALPTPMGLGLPSSNPSLSLCWKASRPPPHRAEPRAMAGEP